MSKGIRMSKEEMTMASKMLGEDIVVVFPYNNFGIGVFTVYNINIYKEEASLKCKINGYADMTVPIKAIIKPFFNPVNQSYFFLK